MGRSFPETLSALRKERNISQRTAAADLNISQALLSHYENGIREPGLGFVCRVCEYYGVSADYLLCRTEKADPAESYAANTRQILDEMQLVLDRARESLKTTQEDKK